MEDGMGDWGDQGSSPSFSLGCAADPLEGLLGFARCASAQGELIAAVMCPVPSTVLVVLREGSSGSADFLFTNPQLYLNVE